MEHYVSPNSLQKEAKEVGYIYCQNSINSFLIIKVDF
jgi:hypothetical protein